MAKLIDLTGQKIDKLLVLEKAPSKARHTYWKCLCDCGNIIEVSSEFLKRTSKNRDCGCSKLKNIDKKQKKSLIGKTFGRLMVIEPTEEKKNGSIVWKCKCECGNFKNVPTHLLTSGHTQSCGCLRRKDITNQRFGKLIALYPLLDNNNKVFVWHCKCDCGNEIDVKGDCLRRGITKSCGCINYSIGEKNIENILKKHNYIFKKEYVVSELNNARFDFAIFDKNNNIVRLIEFDGEQHYNEKRGTWKNHESLETIQKRDKKKNEWALAQNIPLVRIPYWERDKITLEMIFGSTYEI